MSDKPKEGDEIYLQEYIMGKPSGHWNKYKIELFRDCLGVFSCNSARIAGDFTALCDLYMPSDESEKKYISNYGDYFTNMIPAWSAINPNK